MEISSLTDIVQETREVQKEIGKIVHSNINNYIIELIRISKMYEFKLEIKPRVKKQKEAPKHEEHKSVVKEQVNEIKKESPEKEFKQYLNINEFVEDIKIIYGEQKIQVDYSKYKQKKPKARTQELWEKIGFYQEKTTQVSVKVQLWPEHNFYDHFKRRRAFLFC